MFSIEASFMLIGAVALSMLITPWILNAVDKLLLPRFANCNLTPMAEISKQQTAPIFIAGLAILANCVPHAAGLRHRTYRFDPRRQHD